MKLIKPGKPQLPKKWWIGMIAICPTCGAEAMIEEADKTRIYSGDIRTKCPTENCTDSLLVEHPGSRTI